VARFGEARSHADGFLDLAFAPVAGRTRLVRAVHRMPLLVQRTQYLDPAAPDMAFVPLLAVGGGVLGGDRLTQCVRVESGAAAHLTTQAATKLYRAERGYATMDTLLHVLPGGRLEYVPLPIIAQAGARWASRVRLVAEPGSAAIIGEILVPGRLARGECGAFDAVALIAEGRPAPDAEPTWRDALLLLGGTASARDTIATLIAVAPEMPGAALADALAPAVAMACGAGVFGGVSDLPGNGGAMVRMIGADAPAVTAAHRAAWAAARGLVFGLPLPPLRRT